MYKLTNKICTQKNLKMKTQKRHKKKKPISSQNFVDYL